jgi:lipopolysaccharide export system protein LptC
VKNIGATLFPLLLLGLLAALTFWLQRTTNFDDPLSRAKARHDPDSFIEHFTVQRFDMSGDLKNFLVADRLVHFPDDDSTEVMQPALTVYEGAMPTRITARRAWLSHEGKEIHLMDGVQLTHQSDSGRPDTILETARMTAYPDEETAHSDDPVKITQGRSVVVGTGMDYNGKLSTSVLRGRTHGTFYRTR